MNIILQALKDSLILAHEKNKKHIIITKESPILNEIDISKLDVNDFMEIGRSVKLSLIESFKNTIVDSKNHWNEDLTVQDLFNGELFHDINSDVSCPFFTILALRLSGNYKDFKEPEMIYLLSQTKSFISNNKWSFKKYLYKCQSCKKLLIIDVDFITGTISVRS